MLPKGKRAVLVPTAPLQTGLGFLGEGVAALAAGSVAARTIDARGVTVAIATGLVVQAAGTAAMAFLPAHGGLALLLGTSAAMGFGHVLTVVSAVSTITSGLDEADQEVAGSRRCRRSSAPSGWRG